MAPELLGSAQYANAATDLFSLGIVAMVAQTGANPQNWSGPLRQQEQQLAGLDERLKRSVLKAVEESSAERWQSAREWTRDLQEISARRSGSSPMVLGLVGLLLLGALGLGGVAVVGVLLVQADGGDASSAAPLPEVPVPSPVEAEVPVDLPDAAIYVSANGVDDVIEILVDGELVGTCIWDVADCSVNQYVALGQKTHAEVLFRLTNNEYESLCLIGPCGKYSGEFEVRSEGGEALWSDRVYCHSNQGCPGANTPGVKYEKAYLWQR